MINFDAALNEPQEMELVPTRNTGQLKHLDYSLAIAKLKELYAPEMERIVWIAKELQIKDEGTLEIAVNIGGNSKKLNKNIEEQRLDIISIPDKFVREVNAFVKGFKDRLKSIDTTLSGKVQFYKYELDMIERKKADEQKKFLEDQKKKIEAEAKAANIEIPEIKIPEPPPAAPKKITTESGAQATERKDWDFEVVDINKVDPKFLEVKRTAVMADIRAGMRESAGLRIFQKTKTIFK